MNNKPDLSKKISELKKQLVADLMDLVKIPSVYDGETFKLQPVKDAANKCVELLKAAKVTDVEQKCIGDEKKNAPLVYARCGPANPPKDTPTVLLYAHYDVVKPGSWSEAFKPVIKGNRVVGRGAADDKSGVMMHVGVLRAFDGKPPVNLKVVLEGEEESGDTLETYVRKNPDLFKADVIVVADAGNYKLGEPTFTTSLRGVVDVDVTVSTLGIPKHSGVYGGPVPDAFMVLVRMLAKLLDDAGDVAVPGLVREHWQGHEPDENGFRKEAGVLDSVRLIGTDTLGSRLFDRPSVNVVGLDGVPSMKDAVNLLRDTVTARVSLRIAPKQNPADAVFLLRQFLEQGALNPWGAEVTVKAVDAGGAGFEADTTLPAFTVAGKAMKHAYPGKEVAFTGDGGSIPLVAQLQRINPKAALLLIGCQEPTCLIHSYPESVDIDELATMTLAECYLLDLLAPGAKATGLEAMAPTAVPAGTV
ncbi:M20/M25/M40 family metallo-hydrolase [Kitasatospora sp. NPDC048286]|uniref:M20/M25/M40 family metallo-hydrolase n=1 Tax=Kitasatospora sp. NPDC048286 TaxID=3364047 RepID=UPI00371CB5D7